jgi:hypothetical protein
MIKRFIFINTIYKELFMYTVLLSNKTLIVVRPDNTIVGQVYSKRLRALRSYFVLAGRLDERGVLSYMSSIVD